MTLEYFHEEQLLVFLDCFWKFVILEKMGGSVERQMARLNKKLLYHPGLLEMKTAPIIEINEF